RILISVDLPAPLSPTRPTDSPSATSRFTFLSAWTPEYHLCRPWHRMIGCFIVHLYLYLDCACGPAQPCIADNGDHREQADGELEPIGIDVAEHHAVVDNANEEGADDPAQDSADAAGERRPANDGGGDRLQLQ